MSNLRSRLTYANVTATLALLIAVAGGTAYAANTIGSSDVIDNSLLSADLKNNQVRGADVQNEGLTGADIADKSGVDTCAISTRLGDLCVRAENLARPWAQALDHCANLDMRAPTFGEALQLARAHDIPNVDEHEAFWTSDYYFFTPSERRAAYSDDTGFYGDDSTSAAKETVCVTDPTN